MNGFDEHLDNYGDPAPGEKKQPETGDTPRYDDVTVQLSGEDGHPIMIVGRVRKALARAGVPADEVARFSEEALSGDYDNVIQTAMKWVDVQ